MKSIISLLLVVFALQGWGQTIESTFISEKDSLLKKSKNQRTGGIVLLSAGAVFAIAGTSIMSANVESEVANLFQGTHDASFQGGGIFFVLGAVCIISGVAVIFSAAKSKRKAHAATAFLKTEQRPFVHQGSFKRSSFPSLGIKINL